jgi:hypothetical protein
MFRKWLAIIFAVVAFGNAFPQAKTASEATKTCAFSEIYRKDGWTIPGLPALDAKSVRKRLSGAMPDVFATTLTPSVSQTTFIRIWCPSSQNGRLQIAEQPAGIIWLISFDFKGRVFAYGVRYGLERIENGTRRDAGMESGFVFYDLDGSGLFTLRKSTLPMPSPDFIPDWVKKPYSSVPISDVAEMGHAQNPGETEYDLRQRTRFRNRPRLLRGKILRLEPR